jgi:hypothetical protein
VPKSPKAAAKKVGPRASKCLKKASAASTSFDASQLVIPTDDVSTVYFCCFLAFDHSSHTTPWTSFAKKIASLGNECVEFLKAARSSHGKLLLSCVFCFACLSIHVTLLLSFSLLFLCCRRFGGS